MFDSSALIVAHPDDEVIFFSSILNKVDKIIISYLKCPSQPLWTKGRQKSLEQYPLINTTCIGLDESETFHGIDWRNPEITDYGLKISKKNISDTIYKKNFSYLTRYFIDKLAGCKNVFTHNPWGEYGHNEHVQLYRILNKLKKEMSFNLWYSNYCSNKSFELALNYISGFDSDYVTLKTNDELADKIKNIYQENNCWTWFDDWISFNEECFVRDTKILDYPKNYGHIFPLNMIKVKNEYVNKNMFTLLKHNKMVSIIKKLIMSLK
jgi:hypothetical protein